MTLFHTQVTLDGFDFKEFQFTVKLALGINEITPGGWTAAKGNAIGVQLGSPMTWDGTNPNQMRISNAGDEIHARLITIENRSVEGNNVGVVTFKFADLFTIDPAAAGSAIPVVGSRVKGGSTPGSVEACVGNESFAPYAPLVVEVRGTQVVCVKF